MSKGVYYRVVNYDAEAGSEAFTTQFVGIFHDLVSAEYQLSLGAGEVPVSIYLNECDYRRALSNQRQIEKLRDGVIYKKLSEYAAHYADAVRAASTMDPDDKDDFHQFLHIADGVWDEMRDLLDFLASFIVIPTEHKEEPDDELPF